MDEQRTQAYLNLINQLLTCNEGDEPEILQENQELLDQGLITELLKVADNLRLHGNLNNANRLMNIAGNIIRTFSSPSIKLETIYLDFLMEVLQKVAENPNPQVIYPFLGQNLDKLDDSFIKTFSSWAKNKLFSVKAKEAEYIAGIIGNFSNLMAEFSLGNIAINLEIAIAGYQIAFNVFTSDTFPVDWAMVHNNLGNAYRDRIRGSKAENLERAISSLTEALKIRTFKAFPVDWAMTQNNLANAYVYRIRGDKAENLERAISYFTEALTVRIVEAFPVDWAMTQTGLGNAYSDRIRGKKAENLEKAISAFTKALTVITFDVFPVDWASIQNNLANAHVYRIRGDKAENLEKAISFYTEALKVYQFDAFPQYWAMIQNNLGNVYRDRIRGDKAENLEKAISFYTEALKITTFEAFPVPWAMIQNNLGNVYRDRIRGDKAENLEKAISSLTEALKVRTFEAFPVDWAMTQNNLANTYYCRIRGDKAENLERAISSFTKALKVYTFDALPQYWADTQNNLGNVYRDRIRGDKAKNLERAISSFTKALKVRTFEEFPVDWAMTQNNLANAYLYRIRGDKAENLEQAIASYHNALKIYTKEDDPLKCLNTARGLARVHYNEEQWQPATEAYHTAIEAVENARLEALNPQSRQEVLSNAIDVFHSIVQAYLNLDQPKKALEYIERSKGRNLVELMTQKALKPQGVDQEIIDKLAELKQQVINEQIRLQHQSINQNLMRSDNLTPYVQDQSYLKEYQQDLDDFIEKEITPHDENFKLTQKVQPIPFEDIKALTHDSTCLLQWYITGEKILAFIVSTNETVKVWQSSEDDRNQLINTLNNYLQLYEFFRDLNNSNTEWKYKLPDLLQTFADILNINHIISLIPETCERLIIIPHWFLHILPIHAFPVDDNCILQDKYDIQYAPSCQLLQLTKQRPLNQLNNLFAIQNPRKDLIFTDLEVNMISSLFSQQEIIAKDDAVQNTVTSNLNASESHCYHFSCHGEFNYNNPLNSALLLANENQLTLGEIFELNFNKARLVVLSACETGLIDLNSISDEYIGLPAGFLFAGTSSVVSSLWTVSDLSTAFLMMKFYEIILDKNKHISVPVALKMAQNWLKNLTVKEFEENLSNPTFKQVLNELEKQLSFGDFFELEDAIAVTCDSIKAMSPHEKPFKNPFYWAAFTATGI